MSAYFILTRLRLHWYIRAGGNLVLRYWQWFLIAGLFIPSGLFVDLAKLLETVIAGGQGWFAEAGFVIAVQFAALFWILPQKQLLTGGRFKAYASTLPLSKRLRLSVDLTLLVAANSLMLVSVLIATVDFATSHHGAYRICALWGLVGTALVVQLAALEGRIIAVPPVIVSGVVLGGSLAMTPGAMRWMLLAAPLAGAAVTLFAMDKMKIAIPAILQADSPRPTVLRLMSHYTPSLLVQCKAVAMKPGLTALRLCATFGLAFGVDRLVALFRFDQRTLPADIVAMAIIALILSGLYRTLCEAHGPARAYLEALPIAPLYWPVRDSAFVLLLGVLPVCILLTPVLLHGLASLLVVFALMIAFQVLLALMRLPLVFGGSRAVLYAALLAGAWSAVAMAAVTR